MVEIVNLRRARKAKARREKEAKAADNRVRHGLKKTEIDARRWENVVKKQEFDGKKLDSDGR